MEKHCRDEALRKHIKTIKTNDLNSSVSLKHEYLCCDISSLFNCKRHHPDLVAVVEALGKETSGSCANLAIEEISGNQYRIDEYDGAEDVITPDGNDWVTDFFKVHNCCICTNMIAEVQFNKLIVLGLADYVKLIVTSEEADAEKPNDAIYILLANKLSNYGVDVDNCLFIGDNEEHDVLGPREIGFDSMHVDQFIKELK